MRQPDGPARLPETSTAGPHSESEHFDKYLSGDIPADRILSHLAGEALRLEAYAVSGLIDPGEPVPDTVLDAARALQAAGFSGRAI